jgi:hypothetical protein
MDCCVSDLALVDPHNGRFLPDLERPSPDSRGYTKHLEVPEVLVMTHQHFLDRLVCNCLHSMMTLNVMIWRSCNKSSGLEKQHILGNVFWVIQST